MVVVFAVAGAVKAQDIANLRPAVDQNGGSLSPKQRLDPIVAENVLGMTEDWIASQFKLPQIHRHPRIELATPSAITALSDKKLLSDWSIVVTATDEQTASPQPTTISLYDDNSQTIYLPAGWIGRTNVELSILVHEMVHHVQNQLGLKYACAQEREQLAYMAQERWLGQEGRSLENDFDLDPFSLLVATTCKY
jgi:hypothetical protein